MNDKKQPSNRQLKVGQQIRFLVSNFFIKEDFIFENFDSKNLTIVDVVLSPDLKNAKAYVIPLGGKDTEKTVNVLTEFSYRIRKVLSKKIDMKFLPKVSFVGDKSFDYAEKIEKLIQKNK